MIDGFQFCVDLQKKTEGSDVFPCIGVYVKSLRKREEVFESIIFRSIVYKAQYRKRVGEPRIELYQKMEIPLVLKARGNLVLFLGKRAGVEWDDFMTDDGPFFVNGEFTLEVSLQLAQCVEP